MTRGFVLKPPAREPVAVLGVPSVVGESLVLFHLDAHGNPTHSYGYRGWADVYTVDGDPCIEVVTDDDWQRHRLLGTPPPKAIRWPARTAWVA